VWCAVPALLRGGNPTEIGSAVLLYCTEADPTSAAIPVAVRCVELSLVSWFLPYTAFYCHAFSVLCWMCRTRYSLLPSFSEARCTAIVTTLYLYPPKRAKRVKGGRVPWCSLSLILFFHAPFAREKSEYKSISSFFLSFTKFQ
jgi:hypothetical protein